VVPRSRGRIRCRGAANEPTAGISFGLGAVPGPVTDLYERRRWCDIIGPEYVEPSLRFAHAAYAVCVAAGGCTEPGYTHGNTRETYFGNPT